MYLGELCQILVWANAVPEGGVVVEIGSYEGKSAAAWCQGIGNRATLYCVDPWEKGYPGGDASHFEPFNENMRMLGYSPTVLRMTSVEAAKLFCDRSVDVVFIDGNHFEIGLDVDIWKPKVKPSGRLCGHDWRRENLIVKEVSKRCPTARHRAGSLWQCVIE